MTRLDTIAAQLYATGYDATVAGFGPYERLVDEIARLVDRSVDRVPACVLDVACGTGSLARRLARRGHSVTGIDVVPALVERAWWRTPTALADRLAFTVRDAAVEGPPAIAAFDAVVALHTIYWHPDPEGLLRACWAALRPGGHVIVVAYRHAAAVRRTLAAVRREDGVLAAAGALRWLVPTAVFEAMRRTPKRYVDEHDVSHILAHAGFVVRESRRTFLGGVSVIVWAQRGKLPIEGDAGGGSPDILQPASWGRD